MASSGEPHRSSNIVPASTRKAVATRGSQLPRAWPTAIANGEPEQEKKLLTLTSIDYLTRRAESLDRSSQKNPNVAQRKQEQ
jgi:hypothetical protein